MKQEKEHREEIEEFFRTLEEKTLKYQKYFKVLETLPQEPPKNNTLTEYGNSSVSREERANARLEPNLRRT